MSGFNEELIIRYLDNSLSESEEELLLEWLKEADENREIFLTCKKIYASRKIRHYSTPVVLDQALQRFNSRIETDQESKKPIFLLRISRYAAIFILAVAIPYFLWLTLHAPKIKYQTVVVNNLEPVQKITLPDGSQVWVNNNSSFTYPETFGDKNREVTINGEAFFEVKTDSLHPFIVKTDVMHVKVYGTSFNVNTKTSDNTIKTALVTGRVSINDIHGNNLVMLAPGQLATFSASNGNVVVAKVNTDVYTLWRKGMVVFDKATLGEITAKISELYNVHITINSSSKLENKINFVFRKTQPLDTVMEMLGFVAPIKFKIYENQIYIKAI